MIAVGFARLNPILRIQSQFNLNPRSKASGTLIHVATAYLETTPPSTSCAVAQSGSAGSVQPVAGIPKSGEDVAMIGEHRVNGGGPYTHLRMMAVQVGESHWRGE